MTEPFLLREHAAAVSRVPKLFGTVGTRAISLAATAVATTLVVRTLGPKGTGVYFVLITVSLTTFAICHLSVEHAQVSVWQTSGDRRVLAANAMAIGLTIGSVGAVGSWVIVRALGPHLVPISGQYTALAVVVASLPPRLALLYMNGLLALDDRVGRINAGVLVGAIVQVVPTVVLWQTGHLSVTTGIAVWTASAAIPLVVVAPAFGARVHHLALDVAHRTVQIGLRYHAGLVALFLLFRVDVFLLNARVSKAQVGRYALAVTLVELVYVVTDSVAQVVLPRQVGGTLSDAVAYTMRVVRLSLLFSVLAAAGIALGAWAGVRIAFGSGFAGAIPAIAVLAPGVVAMATIRAVYGLLLRQQRTRLVSSAGLATMALNVMLNLALIPHLGIVGSALASTIAYWALALVYLRWMVRVGGTTIGDLLPGRGDLRSARELVGSLWGQGAPA